MSALTRLTAAFWKSLKSHVYVWLNCEGECFPSGWPWWKGKNVKDISNKWLPGRSPRQSECISWDGSDISPTTPTVVSLLPLLLCSVCQAQTKGKSTQFPAHMTSAPSQASLTAKKERSPRRPSYCQDSKALLQGTLLVPAPHHQVHRQKSHDIVSLFSLRRRRLKSQTSWNSGS